MGELQTIKIKDENGKEVELKVITILKKPDTLEKFLLYTFDDQAQNIDIYASMIKEENDGFILDSITEKEDWDLIQKAIEELSD